MPSREVDAFPDWLHTRTGYHIQDPDLFRTALTHPSAQKGPLFNYERLEFLGDAVLNLLVSEIVAVARLRGGSWHRSDGAVASELCSNEVLRTAAHRSRLNSMGITAAPAALAANRKANADLIESVTAALYLDSGALDAPERFVRSVLSEVHAYRRIAVEGPTERAEATPAILPERIGSYARSLTGSCVGASLVATALLSSIEPAGIASARLTSLVSIGSRVHALLCREVVFSQLPEAPPSTLSRAGARLGQLVVDQIHDAPPWLEVSDLVPSDGSLHDSKTRFFALLGAAYRIGSISLVKEVFGEWYGLPRLRGPFPGLSMAKDDPFSQLDMPARPVIVDDGARAA